MLAQAPGTRKHKHRAMSGRGSSGSRDEGPGVSAGPSRPFHGNAKAQEFMCAINELEDSIVAMHGSPFFHQESRVDIIMTLPTEQGWEVLRAMRQAALVHTGVELHKIFFDMVMKRWRALRLAVLQRLGEPDRRDDQAAFGHEEEAIFYAGKYHKLDRLKSEVVQAQSLHLNPGLAWRRGQPDVFTHSGGILCTLETDTGRQLRSHKELEGRTRASMTLIQLTRLPASATGLLMTRS